MSRFLSSKLSPWLASMQKTSQCTCSCFLILADTSMSVLRSLRETLNQGGVSWWISYSYSYLYSYSYSYLYSYSYSYEEMESLVNLVAVGGTARVEVLTKMLEGPLSFLMGKEMNEFVHTGLQVGISNLENHCPYRQVQDNAGQGNLMFS